MAWAKFVLVVAITGTLTCGASQSTAQDSPHLKLQKRAMQSEPDCTSKGDLDTCLQMLKMLREAIATPGATPKFVHDVQRDVYAALAGVGAALLQQGSPKEALRLLEAGERSLFQHYENRKHYHALFEGVPMLTQYLIALHANGEHTTATSKLHQYRLETELLVTRKDDFITKMPMQYFLGTSAFYRLEVQYGEYLGMERPDVDFEKVNEAFERGYTWARRQMDFEKAIGKWLGSTTRVVSAKVQHGNVLLHLNRKEAAAQAFALAKAQCDTPGAVAALGCEDATIGYALSTGQKIVVSQPKAAERPLQGSSRRTQLRQLTEEEREDLTREAEGIASMGQR